MSDKPVVPPGFVDRLLDRVPAMTEEILADVTDAVPEYRQFFASDRGDQTRRQIEIALRTFIRLVAMPELDDAESFIRPAVDGARSMGRSEVRAGRGTEAVLNAFRAGGRAVWNEVAKESSAAQLSGTDVAALAGMLFDYVDRISMATVTGHQEELSGLMRTRDLERDSLVRTLLARGEVSAERAARAEWPVPGRVLLVMVAPQEARDVSRTFPAGSIVATGGLPDASDDAAVVVVPLVHPSEREAVLRAVAGTRAVVGPATRTDQAHLAYRWTRRLWATASTDQRAVDADDRLSHVFLGSEPELLDVMRDRLLGPLSTLPPGTRATLEATLGSWLRHRGRQDRVAAEMFVHPQTVRYRLARLQQLLGAPMNDPARTLDLLMCVSGPSPAVPQEWTE